MPDHVAYSAAQHPAPHAERIGWGPLLYGLFASPIVWAGNFMIDYGLLSHACYPGRQPLPHGQPGTILWLALAFYGITLGLCASAFLVAHRTWRVTGRESEGHAHHLIERGEGRTRFLGLIGMSFSVLFFIASLFAMLIFAIEPLCAFE